MEQQATRMKPSRIAAMQQERREKVRALHQVEQHPSLFRPGFYEWLISNYHIWQAFERKADLMREAGRAHYSARTIVESMRFDTHLTDTGSEYKINGNTVPDLARLYNRVNVCEFFNLRGRH